MRPPETTTVVPNGSHYRDSQYYAHSSVKDHPIVYTSRLHHLPQGYLTHNGKVNLTRVQLIMTDLGMVEDEIFQRRRVDDVRYRERERAKKRRSDPGPRFVPGGQFAPTRLGSQPNPVMNARQEAAQMRRHASSLSANQTAAESMKGWLRKGNDPSGGSSDQSGGVAGQKRKHEQSACAEDDDEPDDDVRFWEDGWKERYYNNKFGVPSTDEEFVADVVKEYVRGLCWVLGYYYQGCPCWKWFYPYHYAPFSSDCRNISRIQSDFARGTLPFRPLEQLMGVFPAASGKFLPPSWRKLMMDEDSRIIDFYPIDFRIDLNGKKYAWQGVALLPFVDEERLKKSLDPVYSDLSPDEVARNSLGSDLIFVYRHNRLYPFLKTIYESYQRNSEENEPVELNPKHTGGVRGTVSCDEGMVKIMNDGGNVTSPLPQLPHVRPTYVMGAKYQNPQYPLDYVHEAVLLPGITMPEKSLRPGGWKNRTPGSYRPQTGFTPPSRAHSYRTPEPAQRMINRSLSDPRHHYGAQPSHPHSRQFQTPSHRGGYDAQQHYYRGSRDHASPGPRQSWNSAPPRAAWHALPPPPAPYHASQYPPPPPPPGNPTGGYFLPPRQQPRPPRPNPYQWDRY